jgi:hypothetical protein
MNILIVSADNHATQMVEAETDTTHLRARKLALKELLHSILAGHKIATIFEEWPRNEMTIAHQFGNNKEPAIPWRNIDMTEDDRRAAGISDQLADRPERLVFGDGPMPERILDRVPSDAVREKFFVNRIVDENHSDGTVLVLLGNEHVAPVKEKLSAIGHTVGIQQ